MSRSCFTSWWREPSSRSLCESDPVIHVRQFQSASNRGDHDARLQAGGTAIRPGAVCLARIMFDLRAVLGNKDVIRQGGVPGLQAREFLAPVEGFGTFRQDFQDALGIE